MLVSATDNQNLLQSKVDHNWDTRDHRSTDSQVKILHLILIKGALSWRLCCILVKTSQIFDKETFFYMKLLLERREKNLKGFIRERTNYN